MDQIVIAHISDVHFGDQLFDPQISRWPPVMPHDPILCASLKLALEDVHAEASLEKDESIDVVLTGDLSERGSTTNFDTAHTYFHKWTLASPGTAGGIGIGLSLARLPMIPGNHDHWDGEWKLLPGPKAYNPKIFPKPFKQTPWHEQLASTKNGITLDLFGVDSNSGFAQNQTSFLAGGLISPKEFGKLESRLKAIPGSGENNVRVILCHHALSQGRRPLPRVLSEDSMAELTRIVHRYRISAVLTGHTHEFFQKIDTSATASIPKGVVEFRSAKTLKGPTKRHSRQGFWVHRIRFDQHNSLEWASWRYQWNGFRFVRTVHKSGPWVSFRI